ncbi:unnamed protein product [Mytilus coruscus]|uniref:Uncharacterized protein n=1 Tax=Mytilus coruscus TaxID=42192 RepID=A0A6J8ADB8_MYTCO|nr:unnamed protein product [Mytilus coruscus]
MIWIMHTLVRARNGERKGCKKLDTENTSIIKDQTISKEINQNTCEIKDAHWYLHPKPLRNKIHSESNGDVCVACDDTSETLEHLIIGCESWDYIRTSIIKIIRHMLNDYCLHKWEDLSPEEQMQFIMNITRINKEMIQLRQLNTKPDDYCFLFTA